MYKESDFKNLLVKLAITLSDAYRILELPENTKDESLIKKNFKKLTLKYHPDLGGSHEKMVELNQAKDRVDLAIKKNDFSTSSDYSQKSYNTQNTYNKQQQYEKSNADWERRKKEREEEINIKKKEVEKIFNQFKEKMSSLKETYIQYFKSIVGSEPRYFIKGKINNSFYDVNFTMDFKFKFEDGSECSLNVSYSKNTVNKNDYYYNSDVYYNNKLYKMQQSKYSGTESQDFFTTPENVFPKSKLIKIFKTQTSKPTTFKRKDAEAMLVKELFAKRVDASTWKIPVDDTHDIYVERFVILRMATWSIRGLYEKYKLVGRLPKQSYYYEVLSSEPEVQNFLDFIKTLKEAKSKNFNWVKK